jgi:putative ATPase
LHEARSLKGVYPIFDATLYLVTAPKSNSANDYCMAFARRDAEGKVQAPKHLQDGTPSAVDARDPSARSGQALGHGEGYAYPHARPDHQMVQQYLPIALCR